jgi:hypothetical protein
MIWEVSDAAAAKGIHIGYWDLDALHTRSLTRSQTTAAAQSERCAAFQETVNDVAGFDFFQGWHAMYGASVVSFLQALDR